MIALLVAYVVVAVLFGLAIGLERRQHGARRPTKIAIVGASVLWLLVIVGALIPVLADAIAPTRHK